MLRAMEQALRRVLCSFPSAAISANGASFEWLPVFVGAASLLPRLSCQIARGSRFRATNSPQYTFIAVSWRQPLAESI